MSENQKSISDIFKARLPDKEFISVSEIVKSGLFRSPNTVWTLLRAGVLPYLRASKNTTTIPKAALIQYIEQSYSESRGHSLGENINEFEN
jgi:hypothetical protein